MPEPDFAWLRISHDESAGARRLLPRIAAGDREAFHAFYTLYGARVMALVRRRGAPPQLAEELVQDVFVAAWQGADGYRPELGEPERWLLGIARHKLLDHWRRMQRIVAAVGLPLDPVVPDDAASDTTLRVSLGEALARLTADQRRVIDLIYGSGLTFAEAAHALAVPAGTVKSRVNTALGKMRAFLTGSRAR
jgi:RNA polymerase sigma-70 factor, ECF subfamily